jgi:alpha-tubulin suppressor-like RCC1 family protein
MAFVSRARGRSVLLGVLGAAAITVPSTTGGFGAFSSFSSATQQVNTEGGMSLASVVLTGDPGGTALTETVVDMQPGDYRERVIDLTVPYDADVTYSVKADVLADATPSAIPGVSQVGDALNVVAATNTGLAATDLSDLNAPAGQGGLFVEIYRCTGAGNSYESSAGVIASRTDDREVSCNNTGVPQGAKGNGTGIVGIDPVYGGISIATSGWRHSCFLRADRTVWCSGSNATGQTGLGTTTGNTLTPTQVGTDTNWQDITAGYEHTCATRTTSTLWCWGSNATGQTGLGTTAGNTLTPTQVGTDTNWRNITAGELHTCATKTTGTLWCWGSNGNGRTGLGTTAGNTLTPTQVGTDTNWQVVNIGFNHTCATKTTGTLWCWGGNWNGQLGNGGTTQGLSPAQVGTDTNWQTIDSGGNHTCAVKTTGTLWCWGQNLYGAVGAGASTANFLAPTQVGSDTNWRTVNAGTYHTCGIRTTNTLWCWGENLYGKTGLGITTGNTTTPAQVGTDTNWQTTSGGARHTCATKNTGSVLCWGYNLYGQIGDTSSTDRSTPTLVQGPLTTAYTTPTIVRPAGATLRLLVRVRFVNDGTTDGRQNTMSNESIQLTHLFALVERAGGAV